MGQLDTEALNDNIHAPDDMQQQIRELRDLIHLLKQAARVVEGSEEELHLAIEKLHGFIKEQENDVAS